MAKKPGLIAVSSAVSPEDAWGISLIVGARPIQSIIPGLILSFDLLNASSTSSPSCNKMPQTLPPVPRRTALSLLRSCYSTEWLLEWVHRKVGMAFPCHCHGQAQIGKATMSSWVPTRFLATQSCIKTSFIPNLACPQCQSPWGYTWNNTEARKDGATNRSVHISMSPALTGAGLGKDISRHPHCTPGSRF